MCDNPKIVDLIKGLLGAIKQFNYDKAYEYAERIALATGNYDIKASLAKTSWDDIGEVYTSIAYASEVGRALEKHTIGHGIIDEILLGGGVGLVAAGVYLKSPAIGVAGAIATTIGAINKIREIAALPDRAKEIGTKIYEKTGLRQHYDDLDAIGR